MPDKATKGTGLWRTDTKTAAVAKVLGTAVVAALAATGVVDTVQGGGLLAILAALFG